ALRSTFRPEAARAFRGSYELRLGDVIVHAQVDRGKLEAAAGGLPGADLVIETGPIVRSLLARELTPAAALRAGLVRLTGNKRLFEKFPELFQIGPSHGHLRAI